jgi:hypothetical protein
MSMLAGDATRYAAVYPNLPGLVYITSIRIPRACGAPLNVAVHTGSIHESRWVAGSPDIGRDIEVTLR